MSGNGIIDSHNYVLTDERTMKLIQENAMKLLIQEIQENSMKPRNESAYEFPTEIAPEEPFMEVFNEVFGSIANK